MKTVPWMRPVMLTGLGLFALGAAALVYAPQNKAVIKAVILLAGAGIAAADWVRWRRR
jgi:hypothetical protein